MSANFYHDEATMRGADMHTYWALGPAFAPVKATTLYITLAVHQAPVDKPAAIVASVTSSKHKMIQGRCKLKYVIHIPIPLGVPHPVMEPVEYGIILYYSSSTPLLRRKSVTAAGHPLAVCIDGGSGLNVNCWEGIKLPSGYVSAENTVMTQPSMADAVDALVDIVIDVIVTTSMKHFEKLIPEKWTKAVKEFLKKKLKDAAQPITRALEKVIKDQLKKLVKDPAPVKSTQHTTTALQQIGIPHV